MEQILIVYDNRAVERFIPDWGFSLLIELDEENVLFDTGAKPEVLRANLKVAEVNVDEIDKVFISHNHWDHVGGLPLLTSGGKEIEIYVPEADCYTFEKELPEPAICIPLSSPTYISDRLLSTGVMPTGMSEPAQEQSLIFLSKMGPVLITGCSHPGIVNIAKRAVTLVGGKLFLTVGGFHLYSSTDEEVREISNRLKSLSKFVAPCHCTGERAMEIFREEWGDRFVDVAAGVEIPLMNLS